MPVPPPFSLSSPTCILPNDDTFFDPNVPPLLLLSPLLPVGLFDLWTGMYPVPTHYPPGVSLLPSHVFHPQCRYCRPLFFHFSLRSRILLICSYSQYRPFTFVSPNFLNCNSTNPHGHRGGESAVSYALKNPLGTKFDPKTMTVVNRRRVRVLLFGTFFSFLATKFPSPSPSCQVCSVRACPPFPSPPEVSHLFHYLANERDQAKHLLL